MISVASFKEWIAAFPDDAGIAVDDGGLNLVVHDGEGNELGNYEIGGIPLEEEAK